MDNACYQPQVKLYTFFSGEWVATGQGILDLYEVKNPSKTLVYERLNLDYTLIKLVVFSDRDKRIKIFKDHIKKSSDYKILHKTILHQGGVCTRAISFVDSAACQQVFTLITKAISGQLNNSVNSVNSTNSFNSSDLSVSDEDNSSSLDKTNNGNLSTSAINMNALDVTGVISINKNNEIPLICRQNLSAWLTIVNCYHAVLNRNSGDSFMDGCTLSDKDGGAYGKMMISLNVCAPYAEAFCMDFVKDNMLEDFLVVFRSILKNVKNESEEEERTNDLYKLFSIFKLLVTFNNMDFLELLFSEPDKTYEMLGIFKYDPNREEPVDHQRFFDTNNCLQYGWISDQLTAAGVALTESIKNSSFVNPADRNNSLFHEESSKLSIISASNYKELLERINKKIKTIQYTGYILKRVLPTTKMFDTPYMLQNYCANLKNELCGVICENLIILESIIQNFFQVTKQIVSPLEDDDDVIDEILIEKCLLQTANTLSFLNEFTTMCNDFTDSDKSAIYEWLLNYPLLKKIFAILGAAVEVDKKNRLFNYYLLNVKFGATFIYKLMTDAYIGYFYPLVSNPLHEIESTSSFSSDSDIYDTIEEKQTKDNNEQTTAAGGAVKVDAVDTLFEVLIKYFEYKTVSQIVINTINLIIGPSPQCMSMSTCDNVIDGFEVDENGDYPEKNKLQKSNFMSNFVKVLERRFEAIFFNNENNSNTEMKVKFIGFCTNYLVSEHYQKYNLFSGENKLIQRFITNESFLSKQSDAVIVELTRFLITAFKLNEISLYQQMVAYRQGLLGSLLAKLFIDRCSKGSGSNDSMLSNSLLHFFAFIVEKNVIVLINDIVTSEAYNFDRELLAASREGKKFYTGLFAKMYRVFQANRRKRASILERSTALEASENDKVINKHNDLSDSQVRENWFGEDSGSIEEEEKAIKPAENVAAEEGDEEEDEEFEVPKTHGEKENDEETESVLDKVELTTANESGHTSPAAVERKK